MSYVVFVEDDPLGAEVARDFLASVGHTVQIVSSPAAAARLMVWSRPHVVLADRCLSRYDGRTLQTTCDRLAVPVIDLASAICLMGRKERRSDHATPESLTTSR